jgi:hypothetical protein
MAFSRVTVASLAVVAVVAATGATAGGHGGSRPAAAGHSTGFAASPALLASAGALDPLTGIAGVSAVSPTQVWAVGAYCRSADCAFPSGVRRTLIARWNGIAWSQLPSPNPRRYNYLQSVSASSTRQAWAVGAYCDASCNSGSGRYDTLITRWNGSAWSRVHSPDPAKSDALESVATDGSGDAWAVGYQCTSECGGASAEVDQTLTLHWNGRTWSTIASPRLRHEDTILFGVTAQSRTDAWAVGIAINNTVGPAYIYRTLILHWNGRKWSLEASPNPGGTPVRGFDYLTGITAVAGNNAWAGGYYKPQRSSNTETMILHWNGDRWSQARTFTPGFTNAQVIGITALSRTNAWASGFYSDVTSTLQAFILHWNGKSWTSVHIPAPGSEGSILGAVTARTPSDAWAVGSYPGPGGQHGWTIHWDGNKWVTK